MAYNDISLRQCKETKNIEACYENYIHTTARWSEYWWSGVVEIYETNTEFQIKYTINFESRTLIRGVCEKTDIYTDYYTPTIKEIQKKYCAYLVYINDGSVNLYSKVGYSANPSQRFAQLESAYVSWGTVVPKAIYYFDNQGAAETMENFMREYFKDKYLSSFVQRDRFTDICFCKKDIEVFDKKAELIAELFSM